MMPEVVATSVGVVRTRPRPGIRRMFTGHAWYSRWEM
jgi:hypothetical protein